MPEEPTPTPAEDAEWVIPEGGFPAKRYLPNDGIDLSTTCKTPTTRAQWHYQLLDRMYNEANDLWLATPDWRFITKWKRKHTAREAGYAMTSYPYPKEWQIDTTGLIKPPTPEMKRAGEEARRERQRRRTGILRSFYWGPVKELQYKLNRKFRPKSTLSKINIPPFLLEDEKTDNQ